VYQLLALLLNYLPRALRMHQLSGTAASKGTDRFVKALAALLAALGEALLLSVHLTAKQTEVARAAFAEGLTLTKQRGATLCAEAVDVALSLRPRARRRL
jgi:hypothetical protein